MFLAVQPMLQVDSIPRAVNLYKALGFRVLHQQSETHAVMGRGVVQLHLSAIEQTPGCQIIVENVEGLYQEISTTDVKVIYPLGDRPWGHRDFTIEDFDGNQITFSQKI